MKRLFWLLPLLLWLAGCQVSASNQPHTPSQPTAMEPPSMTGDPGEPVPDPVNAPGPEPDRILPAAAPGSDPAPTEPDSAAPPPPPAEQEPFLPGDTTPTWNPALAENYPADRDCGAELLLEKWMAVEGLTWADLAERGCEQLVLAAAQSTDGTETRTVCYERDQNGVFVPVQSLMGLKGHVGKNGIMHNRGRNTNTSPAGLWALSFAFGNELPPEDLKLPWRQVTPNSDWVCDETSIYFNTWQERGDPTLTETWSDDVEHLENYPIQYAWACVIEFNRPPAVIPDRGCAIFLHCSEGVTGGCVGLPREDMLAVLQWLDADKNPYILITGAEKSE